MNASVLAYLNLALLAVASVLYFAFDKEKSQTDSRAHLTFITTAPEISKAAATIQSASSAVETDWNCRINVLFTTDDSPSMARALKKALALGTDGVSMPGSMDAPLILPLVAEAHRQGIPVTYHTTPNPEARRRFGEKGAGFVGIEGEDSGYTLAESAVERLNIERDTVVLLTGPTPAIMPGTRLQGCQALLRSRGIQIEYLQVASASDAALTQRVAAGTLPRFIFWDSGPVGQFTALLIEDRLNVTDYRIIALSPAKEDLPMLEARYIGLQAVDRSFLTCYLSLVQLQLTRRYGLQGIEIPIGGV